MELLNARRKKEKERVDGDSVVCESREDGSHMWRGREEGRKQEDEAH